MKPNIIDKRLVVLILSILFIILVSIWFQSNEYDLKYLELTAFIVTLITFVQKQNPNMQIISLLCFNLFMAIGVFQIQTYNNLISIPSTKPESMTNKVIVFENTMYDRDSFYYDMVRKNDQYFLRSSDSGLNRPEEFDRLRQYLTETETETETEIVMDGIEDINQNRFWIESSLMSMEKTVPLMVLIFTTILLASNKNGNLYNLINIESTVALVVLVAGTLNDFNDQISYNVSYGAILPLAIYGFTKLKDQFGINSPISEFIAQLLAILTPSIYFGQNYDNLLYRDGTKGFECVLGFLQLVLSMILSNDYGYLKKYSSINLVPVILTYYTSYATINKLTNNAVNSLLIITVVSSVAAYVYFDKNV
jgi:hypothetical protein